MAKYIVLLNWTDQGIKNVKDSVKRYDAAKEMAMKGGCKLETIYLTFGQYDLVAILDAPNDEAAASFNLRLGGGGNVHGVTLKAFPESDYRSLIAAL